MSAFWQALDWCAHHDPGTPTFLEFYGGRGGVPRRHMQVLLHLASPGLSVASAWPGWLPGWLAGWWLAGYLAGWLVGWWLPGWLFA